MTSTIRDYLKNRGISDTVIDSFNLDWNGKEIVIPITDRNGKLLFNKYRRDPFDETGDAPKYQYDKGSTTELFNIQTLDTNKSIVITEGEFDALCLISKGIPAVSSTGGSQSFKEHWVDLFKDKEVYVCYDSDKPGVKGAVQLQKLIPHARLIWFPINFKGKDVTDWFMQHPNLEDFEALKEKAVSYIIPNDLEEMPEHKRDFAKLIKEYGYLANHFLDLQRELKRSKENFAFTEIVLEEINNKTAYLKKRLNLINQPVYNGNDKIQKARTVLVSDYISFNYSGMAKCPFHDDSTPSLKYYPATNTIYCFAGCGYKDVIDVYSKLFNSDFKQSVSELNGRKS